MFTGIVEAIGIVVRVHSNGTNRDLWVESAFAEELRIDQSISHNGVCLTVVALEEGHYRVTAVKETLERSQIGELAPGDEVNLERCLRVGDRLDGHMVQGHVDTVTVCTGIRDQQGSWIFTFQLPPEKHLLVQKGSICINGVSLTIADLNDDDLSVAIIPYTYEHTNFRSMKVGDKVNIEFDVLGKYVHRMMSLREH